MVSVHATARLCHVMCYITSGKGLTWEVSVCDNPYHAEIISEQNASKTVKISQELVKLSKIKVAYFIWDMAYIYNHYLLTFRQQLMQLATTFW